MLVVTPLTVGAAGYFVDGPDPGRWTGAGAAALGLDGPVGGSLRRLLEGRTPSGRRLVADRPHRRAGWDLTFAAPKSVSLVDALTADPGLSPVSHPGHCSGLAEAHRLAVGDALAWLADHGCVASSGEAAAPVVARFEHRTSDTGDPHLHTHAVLVNLGLSPGGWSALSSGLWPYLRTLGAVYRLALQDRAPQGLTWSRRQGGLVDLEVVPRAAIEAVSRRSSAVVATLAGWEDPELAHRRSRRAVRGVTRGGPAPDELLSWRERVAAAGLDAAALLRPVPTMPPRVPAAGGGDVAGWLAAETGTFSTLDVVRAIGATHIGGLSPAALDAEVAAFAPDPSPYGPRRWTTPLAQAGEVALAAAGSEETRIVAEGSAALAILAEHGLGGQVAAGALGVVTSPRRVSVLPGAPGRSTFVTQASVLAAARSTWEAEGWTVGVASTPSARRRWEALAGLRPAGGIDGKGRWPDVLVVDRADRMAAPALRSLVDAAAERDGKVVLVDGGTLPSRHHPANGVVAGARSGIGPPRLDWPTTPVVLGSERAVLGLGAGDALAAAVAAWGAAPGGGRPRLIGLGPAEVEALNAGARSLRVATGELEGPAVTAAGRAYQVGDEVITLKMVGRAPAGTAGTVVGVATDARSLFVEWAGPRCEGRQELDRSDARRIGHGYAVTAARAGHAPHGVVLLGNPATARHLPTPRLSVVVAPGPLERHPGVLDRMVSAVADGPARVGSAVRQALIDTGGAPGALGERRRLLAGRLHGARLDHPTRPLDADALVAHRAAGRALDLCRAALSLDLSPERSRSHRRGPELGL